MSLIRRRKALKIAASIGFDGFQASEGWLTRFKNRHSIHGVKLTGERGSVDQETVSSFKEKLPTLLQGYSPEDIWNCDETGLFFRTVPDRSLSLKGQDPAGRKRSKERITVMLTCSAVGKFYKTMVIAKSARPRCFRNVDLMSLPVRYTSNSKAWMTCELFRTWLLDFNRHFEKKGRHVVLLLDNAPSHPNLKLSNVKLLFLPPNTTASLQPLDQGILRSMKAKYSKKMVSFILDEMEAGENVEPASLHKKIDLRLAVKWIVESVRAIEAETVKKCFRKCGIALEAAAQSPEPESDLEEEDLIQLRELYERMPSSMEVISFEEYRSLQLPTEDQSEPQPEASASRESTSSTNQQGSDTEDEEEDTPQLTKPQILSKVNCLRLVLQAKGLSRSTEALMHLWNVIEEESASKTTKQSSIKDFFKTA